MPRTKGVLSVGGKKRDVHYPLDVSSKYRSYSRRLPVTSKSTLVKLIFLTGVNGSDNLKLTPRSALELLTESYLVRGV